jgi:hypothetical protein
MISLGMMSMVGLGLALAFLLTTGCATSDEDIANEFIREMDAMPPEQQLPNWKATRALMMREAPKVGEHASDLQMKTLNGDKTVRLQSLWRDKPAVLVFGSWT